LGSGKWDGIAVAFNEILAYFGANEFQQETQVPNDGVVAQNSVPSLLQIMNTHDHQSREQQHPPQARLTHHKLQGRQNPKRHDSKKCEESHWDALINPIQHFSFPLAVGVKSACFKARSFPRRLT
jgi:hypothetical protein